MREVYGEENGGGKQKSGSMLSGAGLVALGAGLMYILDPERGARRRGMVRDKFIHWGKVSQSATRKTAEYVRGRTRGIVAETASRFGSEQVTDEQLQARVRSTIGRVISHPSAIEVSAKEGTVTLRGPILKDEMKDLLSTAASVRGVKDVVNELEVHQDAMNVPALQGQPRRRIQRHGVMQEYWTPWTRLLMGIGGSVLGLWGAGRGGIVGAAGGILGTGLLARALTNLSTRRLTGVGAGHKAVNVQKTITIHAPVDQVFDFFGHYENFPRFMSNIQEVRDLGGGRSHWVVKGPMGMTLEWDAEVTDFVPNRSISWKSRAGSTVENAGTLRFEEKPEGTRVDIKLVYNPPAGAVGHALAKAFGADPKSEMDEDLMRVKTMIETGHPARDAAQPVQEAQR